MAAAERYFQKAVPPSPEALWVAVFGSRAAAARKRWGKVVHWAEQGLALKVKEAEAEGWLHLFLGTAQIHMGNAKRAEKAFDRFDRLARRTAALRPLQPFADYNRALLMRFLKRDAEEIASLQNAEKGALALGLTRTALQCRLEICWSRLLQSEPEVARTMLEEVGWHSEDGDTELLVDAAICWGLYYRLTGRLDDAERRCREALVGETLTCGQHAELLWVLGCVAQARGDLTLARQYGEEAHKVAMEDYWPAQVERIETLRKVAMAN